jgi:ArsR family transcriptional regulator, virulence genes transcriptional regulator
MKKETVKKDSPDWEIFERQSRICKAFANPIRLFILHQLGKQDWSVAELQKMLGISVPNISQHLAILKSAGVIVTRREGKRVFCSLPIPEVKQACDLIHNVLRRQIRDTRNLVA